MDPSPKEAGNPLYIITEHMQIGVLLQFLKEKGSSLNKKQLCRMCTDVCKVLFPEEAHTETNNLRYQLGL